jgi:ACT domain-containing protein
VTDSAAIDSINSAGMVDVDAAMEYPEMPSDQKINMKANDDEIKDIIDGTGDGDMTKEGGDY